MSGAEGELSAKMTKMLHRFFDAPEQAAATFRMLCDANGLHFTDLAIVVRGPAGLLAEVEELRKQNAFLRRFAPKRWDEFLALAASKLDVNGRGGLTRLAAQLGCKLEYLVDCRKQGQVPWALVEKLTGLEDKPVQGRAERLDRGLREFVAKVAVGTAVPPAEMEEVLGAIGERRIKPSQIRRALLALSEEMRPADSPHPMNAAEVEAMLGLWETRRELRLGVFVTTHLGREVDLLRECDRLSSSDRRRLRRAYWAELRMRDRNEAYRRISHAAAEIQRVFGAGEEDGVEARVLAYTLLGEKPLDGLRILTGLQRDRLARLMVAGIAPDGLTTFLKALSEMQARPAA